MCLMKNGVPLTTTSSYATSQVIQEKKESQVENVRKWVPCGKKSSENSLNDFRDLLHLVCLLERNNLSSLWLTLLRCALITMMRSVCSRWRGEVVNTVRPSSIEEHHCLESSPVSLSSLVFTRSRTYMNVLLFNCTIIGLSGSFIGKI